MKNVLQVHNVQLEVLAPLHIASGITITKKEYLVNKDKIQILDIPKLFSAFSAKGANAERDFSDYLLNPKSFTTPSQLARNHSLRIEDFIVYELDSCLDRENTNFKKLEIKSFIKDSYGLPYIPGSSLKGAIRSALIAYKVYNSSSLKSRYINEIKNTLNTNARDISKVSRKLEEEFDVKDGKKFLSGLIVSDSKPVLEKNSLILAQKYDYSIKEEVSSLPIYRESLRPKIKIDFTITIDTSSMGDIDVPYIQKALNFYQKQAFKYFYNEFNNGDDSDGIIWLGGGAGFTSKTIIYQLFEDEASRVTNDIFRATLPRKIYELHNHDNPSSAKLSPHMSKCTVYDDHLYDMGKARIRFLD